MSQESKQLGLTTAPGGTWVQTDRAAHERWAQLAIANPRASSVLHVLVAQMGHRFSRRRLAAAGLGAITWCLIMLGQLRGNLSITLVLCGILGIGAALVAIPAQTTIQEDTPESQRGRVFGLQNNLINIALSLPLVLAGALVSSIGLIPVLWVLAALSLAAALWERPWERC